jgi:hypothetical protein
VYVTNVVTLKGFYMTILITKDEVLKMAREAGISTGKRFVGNELVECITIEVQTFAKLVAEAEREACAKVCDELSKKHSWEGCYANECAEAIRARGTNE